jgi:hypothetical protein
MIVMINKTNGLINCFFTFFGGKTKNNSGRKSGKNALGA